MMTSSSSLAAPRLFEDNEYQDEYHGRKARRSFVRCTMKRKARSRNIRPTTLLFLFGLTFGFLLLRQPTFLPSTSSLKTSQTSPDVESHNKFEAGWDSFDRAVGWWLVVVQVKLLFHCFKSGDISAHGHNIHSADVCRVRERWEVLCFAE